MPSEAGQSVRFLGVEVTGGYGLLHVSDGHQTQVLRRKPSLQPHTYLHLDFILKLIIKIL